MVLSFFTEKAFAKFQAFNYQALNLLKHTPTRLCNQTILGLPKVCNIKQLEE